MTNNTNITIDNEINSLTETIDILREQYQSYDKKQIKEITDVDSLLDDNSIDIESLNSLTDNIKKSEKLEKKENEEKKLKIEKMMDNISCVIDRLENQKKQINMTNHIKSKIKFLRSFLSFIKLLTNIHVNIYGSFIRQIIEKIFVD